MPDEQSLDFGAELAQAREQRGITLTELSRRQNRRRCSEGDRALRYDALPAADTRGFLRACPRSRLQSGRNRSSISRKIHGSDVAAHAIVQLDSGVSLTCAPGQVHVKDIDAMTRRRSRTAWMSGSALVLIGTAIHFAWAPSTSWKVHRDAALHPAPKGEPSSAAAPSSQASSVAAQAAATGTSGASRDVGLSARRTCPRARSISMSNRVAVALYPATADGQRVLYRLMTAGDHAQIEAHDDVVLLVGDPSTCGFDINGTGVRRLGAPGQPVTVHLTRDNLEQYLDRSGADRHD